MFVINGINWDILLVPSTYYKLRRNNSQLAIAACDNETKTIYLSNDIKGDKLKKVLCHQITHAAMFSYNVNLTIDQQELIADIISTYGNEINYIVNKVFKKIKRGF